MSAAAGVGAAAGVAGQGLLKGGGGGPKHLSAWSLRCLGCAEMRRTSPQPCMGSDRWRAAWSGGFKEGLCRSSEEGKRQFEVIMYNVSLSDLLTVVIKRTPTRF